MMYLKHLFAVIVKPKKIFEELQGNVQAKEGIIAWSFCMILGFMIAYIVARKLEFEFFFIDFGAGNTVEILSMLIRLGISFVMLIVTSGIATLVSSKLGGNGTFSETIGMLGYTKAVVILRGLTASVFTFIAWTRITSAIRIGAAGGGVPENLFSVYVAPALIITGLFTFWSTWLESRAVSTSNNISMKKAFPIMIILTLVLNIGVGLLI